MPRRGILRGEMNLENKARRGFYENKKTDIQSASLLCNDDLHLPADGICHGYGGYTGQRAGYNGNGRFM